MPRATNWRQSPSTEYRFFLYDPEGDGFMFFASAEERDAASTSVIGDYLDEFWSEEVTGVCAGELTAIACKTNVQTRPKRGDYPSAADHDDALTEYGCDSDERCDYELRPLPAAK